jgi:2-polyprenyl-6-methoxyphenol hydroxylase-like FAD-dependent oxidoreductase
VITRTTATEATPVLIVGAGPVGLCMAIALRRRGIDCTVVECHPSTLYFPKGRLVTIRSMEIFREWGFDRALEAAGLPRDESLFVFSAQSLLAPAFERSGRPNAAMTDAISPTERLLCDQMAMEAVLLVHAQELGADLRFSTTLAAFDQDDLGVGAELVDALTGQRTTLRADWMIAADGARSTVRTALGFERSGSGRHGAAVSIYFHAPLGARMSGRTAGRYDLTDLPGASVMVVDNDERWLIIRNYDPTLESSDLFTSEWALALARRAIGDPTVPIDIVGVQCWESFTLVADRYRAGRVFLAGDAAHVTTPIGGLGMNCGVADVHNLAWKLAGVIDGWAPPGLLDTYEPERRPVAAASAEASRGAARPPAATHGIVLGYAYESAAIVPDGTDPPIVDDTVNDYVPTARPGHRAPHLWLDREKAHSTLDLFGDGFVLLTDETSRANGEATLIEARAAGIPVRLIAPDSPKWRDVYGISRGGTVLVRPDGHVAARHAHLATKAELTSGLLQASGHIPPG